eukprot:scaffold42424_cov53-Phaeocystis_antarctica.AAC.1
MFFFVFPRGARSFSPRTPIRRSLRTPKRDTPSSSSQHVDVGRRLGLHVGLMHLRARHADERPGPRIRAHRALLSARRRQPDRCCGRPHREHRRATLGTIRVRVDQASLNPSLTGKAILQPSPEPHREHRRAVPGSVDVLDRRLDGPDQADGRGHRTVGFVILRPGARLGPRSGVDAPGGGALEPTSIGRAAC